MTIQYGPGGVCDGIVVIGPLHQHCVDGAEAPFWMVAITCPFNQLWQQGEDRGWITLSRGRLAEGECDLSLSDGVAGQGVH
ncbi:hypothetical protein D3C79_1076540 [compost metagenome]